MLHTRIGSAETVAAGFADHEPAPGFALAGEAMYVDLVNADTQRPVTLFAIGVRGPGLHRAVGVWRDTDEGDALPMTTPALQCMGMGDLAADLAHVEALPIVQEVVAQYCRHILKS